MSHPRRPAIALSPRPRSLWSRALLLLLLPAGFGPSGIRAQETARPTLSLGHGLVRTTGNASERWELQSLWSVAAELPAGPLVLRGQLDLTDFEGRFPDHPSLDAASAFVGLGLRRELPGGFAVGGGTSVGILRFWNDAEVLTGAESEILTGLRGELLSPVWRGWGLALTGELFRVHYADPLDVGVASLRVRKRIGLGEAVAGALAGSGAAEADRGATRKEPVTPPSPPSPHWTLTADELSAAGVRTPEHLLDLLEGWAFTSPNGSTTTLSAPNGLPFASPRWRLVVDGLEAPVGALGSTAVDRLPFVLEEVDSIHVYDGPGIVLGRSTDDGLLRVFTRRPEGLEVSASAGAENSAGDPGLATIRGEGPLNVERTGESVGGWSGIGGRAGSLAYSGFWRTRAVNDPPIRARQLAARGSASARGKVRPRHHAGRGELRLGRSRHVVRVSETSGEDYLHLPPLGGEVLIGNRVRWAGVRGQIPLGRDADLGYRGSVSDRTLEPWEGDTRSGLGFEERVLSGGAHLRGGPWLLEAEGERRTAGGRFELRDDRIGNGRVRLSRSASGLRVSTSVGRGSGSTFFDLLAAWSGRLTTSTALHASALVARAPGKDPGSLASWVSRGYGFLDEVGVTPVERGDPRPGLRLVGDVRIRHRTGAAATLEGGLAARRETALTLALPTVRVVDGLPLPADTVAIRRDAAGTRVSVWAAARAERGSIRAAARLDRTVLVRGETAWRRAWDAVPATRARVALSWLPAPDLSLQSRLRYRSATRWEGYDVEGSEVDGAVPAAWELSLAGRKSLWNGRLAGTLRLDDVLDADRPTHPFGESLGMRLSVSAAVRLR